MPISLLKVDLYYRNDSLSFKGFLKFPEMLKRDLNLACRGVGHLTVCYCTVDVPCYRFQKDYVIILIHILVITTSSFLTIIILIQEYRVQILVQRVKKFHIFRFKLKVKNLAVLLNPSLMY